jgi:integrase
MPSYNIYPKSKNSKEETPLYIRFSEKGDNLKFYVGRKIAIEDWDFKKHRAKKNHPGYSAFNAFLSSAVSCLEGIYEKLNVANNKVNRAEMRAKFNEFLSSHGLEKKVPPKYLADFIADYLKEFGPTLKKNTKNHFTQTMSFLRSYELYTMGKVVFGNIDLGYKKELKSKYVTYTDKDAEDYVRLGLNSKFKKLRFEDVNLEFHKKFIQYAELAGYSKNWYGKIITNIKFFMSEAQDNKLHNSHDFKHKKFKSFTQESGAIYITELELERIYNYDFSWSAALDNARDLFLIGCFTALRSNELMQLAEYKISNKMIEGVTTKTGAFVKIPIHNYVDKILEKHNGIPTIISAPKMNKHFKKVCKQVGLDDEISIFKKGKLVTNKKYEFVTTHTMRRSFATNMYKRGVPTYNIMLITGHKTEASFFKYIKIDGEENVAFITSVWEKKTINI